MKTALTALVLMTAIAVGTFSAFKYGVVEKIKSGTVEMVNKALGRNAGDGQAAADGDQAETPQAQTAFIPAPPAQSAAPADAAAPALANSSLRPPRENPPAAPIAETVQTAQTVMLPPMAAQIPSQNQLRPAQGPGPVPGPVPGVVVETILDQPVQQVASSFIPAAVTVAQAGLTRPPQPVAAPVAPQTAAVDAGDWVSSSEAMPVTDVAVPETARRPLSAAQAQAQMLAAGQQRAQAAALSEDISAMSAPAPVLSEAKKRIKAIDQLLSSDPAEALRRLDDLAKLRMSPEDAAEAGYRRGYVGRLLRDEANAEKAWKETAEQYPTLRGGRFSALALGDTWYHKYAGQQPQSSFWDGIQIMYSRVLGKDDAPFLPEQVKEQVKEKLKRLNDALFFGGAPSKLARYHKVEPGELLSGIANKYRVDYESIARINGIDPNRIRSGMDLKLVVGDVEVIVRKNSRDPGKQPTLTWFLDGRWLREYPCCVGDGNKTPAGTYTFTSKERFPSWTNPANGQLLPNDHPENILGSRWMAMRGMNTQGLGIHGTTVDDSIPGYTSAGCVRLLNKDVEELFSFGRIGGKVTVVE